MKPFTPVIPLPRFRPACVGGRWGVLDSATGDVTPAFDERDARAKAAVMQGYEQLVRDVIGGREEP